MHVDIELPPVTKYQRDALFTPHRHAVVEATTKAGKTFGCIIWILEEAGKAPEDSSCWWIAPIYPQAQIAFRRLKVMLTKADPDKQGWSCNEAEMTVVLAGNRRIVFKSGDKPDGLYGEDVYAAVIDEASRCKEPVWAAVVSTLTATAGRVRIIGNVKGRKNWAYKLGQRAKNGGHKNWHYAKITAADAVRANVLKLEVVQEAKEILPAHVYRELYEAEPGDDGSNPFGWQHIEACKAALSRKEPVAFGVDLARKEDFTVVIGLDEDGRACRFERWNQVPWKETIDRIAGIIGDVPTLVDATGNGDAPTDTLQRRCAAVEPFIFTAPSKQTLIEGLIVAIQSAQVAFPEGVIVDELESFEYEVHRTGYRYAAADGYHDDAVCALALAVKCRRERSINISFKRIDQGVIDSTPDQWQQDVEESERLRLERADAFFSGR